MGGDARDRRGRGGGDRGRRGRGGDARGRRGRGGVVRGRRGRGGAARDHRGRGGTGRGRGVAGHCVSVDSESSSDDMSLREWVGRRKRELGSGRGRPRLSDSTSSEEEFCPSPTKRPRGGRGHGDVRAHGVRGREGMMVRKKFGRKYFDGEVVSTYVNSDSDSGSTRYHVKYTDGDSEDLSESDLNVHIDCYNSKYNR